MARPTQRRVSRRASVEETGGGFRPSQNVYAQVYGTRGRSEAEDVARELQELLGVSLPLVSEVATRRNEREFEQGEIDARAGQIDEERRKKFRAYDKAATQVGIEADMIRDAEAVRAGAAEAINSDDPEALDAYLNERFEKNWAGRTEEENQIILPMWASLREELHAELRANTQAKVKAKQYDDVYKIAEDLLRAKKNEGVPFDHQALHDRVRSLFPGKESNEVLSRVYESLMEDSGDTTLLDTMPDQWADGTPSLKRTPGFRERLQQAQTRAFNKTAEERELVLNLRKLEAKTRLDNKLLNNEDITADEITQLVEIGVLTPEEGSSYLGTQAKNRREAREKAEAERKKLIEEQENRARELAKFEHLQMLEQLRERGASEEEITAHLDAGIQAGLYTGAGADEIRRRLMREDAEVKKAAQLAQIVPHFKSGNWGIFKGKVSDEDIKDAFDAYMEDGLNEIRENVLNDASVPEDQKAAVVKQKQFEFHRDNALRNSLVHRPTAQLLSTPDFTNAERFGQQVEAFEQLWTGHPRLARMYVEDDSTFDMYVTANVLRRAGRDPQQLLETLSKIDPQERSKRWMEGNVREETLKRLKKMDFARVGQFFDAEIDDLDNAAAAEAEARAIADALGSTGMFTNAADLAKTVEEVMKGRYMVLDNKLVPASADIPQDMEKAFKWFKQGPLREALDREGLRPDDVELVQTTSGDLTRMEVYLKGAFEPVPGMSTSLAEIYDAWKTEGSKRAIDEANAATERFRASRQQLLTPEMIEAQKRIR